MTNIKMKATDTLHISSVGPDSIAAGGEFAVPRHIADDLEKRGLAARIADHEDEALRDDGPTVEEFVKAGYPATSYPPRGYASRSTDEEIAAAIADAQRAQNVADEEKAAAALSDKAEGKATSNKADKAPANKAK